MKIATAKKLQEYIEKTEIEFTYNGKDFEINYTLSDEEVRDLVELEYGQTNQDVVQLFQCILKSVVKLAAEKIKEDRDEV